MTATDTMVKSQSATHRSGFRAVAHRYTTAFHSPRGVLGGLQEVGVGPAGIGDGVAEDGGGGEEREDLAGHKGLEAGDFAGADVRPFGVGAG